MSKIALRRAAAVVGSVLLLVGLLAVPAAAEPTAVVRWYGDASSATGAALGQGPCDVNGDDYDDIVVGAWFWDKAPNNNIGASYVLLGGPEVSGGDLNTPAEAGAVRIDGPNTANAFTGFGVGCLGDTNGDGFDDLGISYYTAERGYVVFGAEDFGSVDLTNLGEQGYELQGDTTGALAYNVGFSLAGAGDLDGDGLDDIAIAGVVADTLGRTNNGRIWIVAGKEDVANVDLLDPAEGELLSTIDGRGNEDRLGQMAPAGDVNGDEVDDIVVGAYTSTPWGSGVAVPGQAWVVFGGGDGVVDLAAIGSEGFSILGPQRQRDRLGISVSGAGDVNGDGLDDVIVGGDGVYNAATGQRPGSAWVVFGSASTTPVYTATAPDAPAAVYACGDENGTGECGVGQTQPRGYWIQGVDTDPGNGSEAHGYALAGIGDVSGDDIPDFAIGAYGYDPMNPAGPPATMAGAGAVWVVYGKTSTTTQSLADLTAEGGYRIDGLANGDRFGRQVAVLGDIDGNGVADFAGGGDFAQRPLAPGTPRTQAGEVALALLGALSTETTVEVTATEPVVAGDTVDLSASVVQLAAEGGPVGAGTVTFLVDDVAVAGCTDVAVVVEDGTAACADVLLATVGVRSLTAEYTGTATVAGSVSAAVEQPVRARCQETVSTVELALDEEATAEADVVSGTEADDTVAALAGADLACGRGGADALTGGPDADHLLGELGADTLVGGNGDDRLIGGLGADGLRGGLGDDVLNGGNGPDTLRGGLGVDLLRCGAGRDTVFADPTDHVADDCEVVNP